MGRTVYPMTPAHAVSFDHREMESNGSLMVCNATNSTVFDSCWSKTLLCASDSPIHRLLPILQALILPLYFVFGLGLNGFLVFVVLRYEELRRREFALVLQVVVADLMTVICVFPVVTITRPAGLWSLLGQTWCSLLGFIQVLFSAFRYISMFLLAFDRLNMVFFPFVYPSRGNKIMISLTTAVWVLSLLLATIPLVIQCYGFEVFNGFCTVSIICSNACTVVLLDPLVIMKHQDVTMCVLKLLRTLKTEFRGRCRCTRAA
ncbi:hypothetical protein EMCRGX_G026717 [Ephydatia muelleri]